MPTSSCLGRTGLRAVDFIIYAHRKGRAREIRSFCRVRIGDSSTVLRSDTGYWVNQRLSDRADGRQFRPFGRGNQGPGGCGSAGGVPRGGRDPGPCRRQHRTRGTSRGPGTVSGFGWFGSSLGLAAGQGPGWSQGRCPGRKAQVIEDGPNGLRGLDGRQDPHAAATARAFENVHREDPPDQLRPGECPAE